MEYECVREQKAIPDDTMGEYIDTQVVMVRKSGGPHQHFFYSLNTSNQRGKSKEIHDPALEAV